MTRRAPARADRTMAVLITILRWLVAIVGMAVVAWIAWKLVNRQEARDAEFQRKLDADDARASKGRFGPPPKM
jgi:TRAP-type C4-dicarboxylate transport system permease small subunit